MEQRTVAIIGASADRRKFGNRSLRAHQAAGYRVFPVNRRGGEIEGLPVYRRLADVPVRPLDRVSLYVAAEVGMQLLEEIAAHGCRELWLNPGSESPALVARAKQLGLPVVQACSLIDAQFEHRTASHDESP